MTVLKVGMGAGLLVIVAVFAIYALLKRRWARPRSTAMWEQWIDQVVGNDRDPRRSFTPEEKEAGLRRCGYLCEQVDDSGMRCGVMHGINGMKLDGDHIYPHDANGRTIPANLAMLCPTHNRQKSASLPTEGFVKAIFANRTLRTRVAGTVISIKSREPRPSNEPESMYEWEELAA